MLPSRAVIRRNGLVYKRWAVLYNPPLQRQVLKTAAGFVLVSLPISTYLEEHAFDLSLAAALLQAVLSILEEREYLVT